ncbi:MAG: cyclodeaminase/cyclohydrolase family protein [Phycisphaerales bacterium]
MTDSIARLPLGELLAQLGDKRPAPGGGAAACLAGATAAALARMVVEYSLGRKSLAEHAGALEAHRRTLLRLTAMFIELADEDAAAYGLVNHLSRLPEGDPRRAAELPSAQAAAIAAPRAALAAASDLLRLLERLVTITNPHLRSDLAIAAVLAEGAARSAWWNIAVNLPTIADERARAEVRRESDHETAEAEDRRKRIDAAIAPTG